MQLCACMHARVRTCVGLGQHCCHEQPSSMNLGNRWQAGLGVGKPACLLPPAGHWQLPGLLGATGQPCAQRAAAPPEARQQALPLSTAWPLPLMRIDLCRCDATMAHDPSFVFAPVQ